MATKRNPNPKKKPARKAAAPLDVEATPAATDEATAAAPAAGVDLTHIVEALRPLAVPIGELVADPANARKHGVKNLEAIAASLRVYGQRKPIVVNKRNSVVQAGNGTLAAALSLGWQMIAAVYVDDDPATAAGFAIADNRTAELAEWDAQALDQLLRSVQTEDQELASMLDDLAQSLDLVPGEEPDEPQPAEAETVDRTFQVIVDCRDEQQQLELLEEFAAKGMECRALTI